MGEKGNVGSAVSAVEQVGREAAGVARTVGVGVVTSVATDTAKERLTKRGEGDDDGGDAEPG
jgi:hypothetical protein